MNRMFLAALALACVASPVMAEVATGATVVTTPIGQYLTDALVAVVTVAVPILTTIITNAIRSVAPWAMLFLSQKRIEMMVTNGLNYALNAEAAAMKDKVLTIPVGSAVIAKAVQYLLDTAPPKVIAAAGGAQGIAEKIFRLMHLEEGATAANVLAPVQNMLPSKS